MVDRHFADIDLTLPTLAERLRSLQACLGVNQSDLAAIAGVSRTAVGKWYNGGKITDEPAKALTDAANKKLAGKQKISWRDLQDGILRSTAVPGGDAVRVPVPEAERSAIIGVYQAMTPTERTNLALYAEWLISRRATEE